MATPKDFSKKFPFSSARGECEAEVVAQNIMTILGRTGDTFRHLSWEEYKEERLKDKNFTEGEKMYFDSVIGFCKSEDTARLFSDGWKNI